MLTKKYETFSKTVFSKVCYKWESDCCITISKSEKPQKLMNKNKNPHLEKKRIENKLEVTKSITLRLVLA